MMSISHFIKCDFLLKMFVACLWPTHTILSQLGKRKKPLYKGFCILLVSKILTFRELYEPLYKAHMQNVVAFLCPIAFL